jgi:hypothetical protein
VHALHEAALCIIAQGRKQVMLAGELYIYDRDDCQGRRSRLARIKIILMRERSGRARRLYAKPPRRDDCKDHE